VLPGSLGVERRSHPEDSETLHNGDGGAEKKWRKKRQQEARRKRKLNRKDKKLKTRKKKKSAISPSSSQQSKATSHSFIADGVSAHEDDCSSPDSSTPESQGSVADINSAFEANSPPTPGPYPHSFDCTRHWSSYSHHPSLSPPEPNSAEEAVAAKIEECYDLLCSTLEDCSASIRSQIPPSSDTVATDTIESFI